MLVSGCVKKGLRPTCALSFSKKQRRGKGEQECLASCINQTTYEVNLTQEELVEYLNNMARYASTPEACCTNKWKSFPKSGQKRLIGFLGPAVQFVPDKKQQQALLERTAAMAVNAGGGRSSDGKTCGESLVVEKAKLEADLDAANQVGVAEFEKKMKEYEASGGKGKNPAMDLL